jgi:formylglycine-generating enzyme required for sulfatase activity
MAGPRVFLSHHPADSAFGRALADDLRAAGADVWYDERDLDWDELRRALDQELPTRPYFLVVLSPEAVASERIGLAVDIALELMRTREVREAVALVARPCPIPPTLADFRRLDATAGLEPARAGLLVALGLSTEASAEASAGAALVPADRPSPALASAWSPTVLPPPLDQLGFKGWRIGEEELIVPPVRVVPAGPFDMGSDEGSAEAPVHTVSLPLYAVATYPVIVAEYACFVRSGHALPPDLGRVTWETQFSRLDHPVVNVSWHDAVAYAAWLRRWTGQPWRLPTEAEWEKAARWDPTAGGARVYPWGDTFDSVRCNTRESTLGSTTPVGTYPNGASPCGAQDMAGNVREWTSTLYDTYPYAPDDGREAMDVIGERVQRGGSWFGFGSDAQSAQRDGHAPDEVSSIVGFRLVLDAPPGI